MCSSWVLSSHKQLGCSALNTQQPSLGTWRAFLFVPPLVSAAAEAQKSGASATKLLEALLCVADVFVVYERRKFKEWL